MADDLMIVSFLSSLSRVMVVAQVGNAAVGKEDGVEGQYKTIQQ